MSCTIQYKKFGKEFHKNLENDLPNPEVDGRGVSGRNVSVASKLSSKNLRMFSSSSN